MISKLLPNAAGLLGSTHPIPSFSVSGFSILLALGYAPAIDTLVVVGLSVLAQQFSVGLSNDWLDYWRDSQVGRKDKPTARGQVSVKLVRNASLVSGVIAFALASSVGWAAALMMVAMLVVGWSYNLGLKTNQLSVLPYAVGFGILPIYVTLTINPAQMPPWWVVVAASLLGVSAHFANALPDLFDDKETGVRALPHVLGQKVSALVIASAAGFASLLVLTQSTKLNPAIATSGLVLSVGLALTASLLALRPRPPRVIFHLLIAATFVNVVLLLISQSSTFSNT